MAHQPTYTEPEPEPMDSLDDPEAPPDAEDAEARPRRGKGPAIGLITALLAFCLIAAIGGYLLIDNLADRGPASPEEAVDGFLNALLADRDPEAARTFVCEEIRGSDFAANLEAITAAEQASGQTASITWDQITTVSETDDTATVTADVSHTTADGTDAQTWTFTVVRDPEWYVCGFATPQ